MTAAASMLAATAYLWMKEPDRVKPNENFLRMGVQGLRTLSGESIDAHQSGMGFFMGRLDLKDLIVRPDALPVIFPLYCLLRQTIQDFQGLPPVVLALP